MPVCRFFMKNGECREPNCVFKHSPEDIKDCNMYILGFCIHGPLCRYRHLQKPGPPPTPEQAARSKPGALGGVDQSIPGAPSDHQASGGMANQMPRLMWQGAQQSRPLGASGAASAANQILAVSRLPDDKRGIGAFSCTQMLCREVFVKHRGYSVLGF